MQVGEARNFGRFLAQVGAPVRQTVNPSVTITLVPFDDATVERSVTRTRRCVVISEAAGFAGMAAEVAARVTERCFHSLHAPVGRVSGLEIPYPAPMLEHLHLPGVDRILDAISQLQWDDEPVIPAVVDH